MGITVIGSRRVRVVQVGAGGVGSEFLHAFVLSSRLDPRLARYDVVDLDCWDDLARQLYRVGGPEVVGRSKAEVGARRASDLGCFESVRAYPENVLALGAALFRPAADDEAVVVVVALDNVTAAIETSRRAMLAGAHLVIRANCSRESATVEITSPLDPPEGPCPCCSFSSADLRISMDERGGCRGALYEARGLVSTRDASRLETVSMAASLGAAALARALEPEGVETGLRIRVTFPGEDRTVARIPPNPLCMSRHRTIRGAAVVDLDQPNEDLTLGDLIARLAPGSLLFSPGRKPAAGFACRSCGSRVRAFHLTGTRAAPACPACGGVTGPVESPFSYFGEHEIEEIDPGAACRKPSEIGIPPGEILGVAAGDGSESFLVCWPEVPASRPVNHASDLSQGIGRATHA